MNLLIKLTIINIFLMSNVFATPLIQLATGRNGVIPCGLSDNDVDDVEWYAKVTYDSKYVNCQICPNTIESNCQIALNSIKYKCTKDSLVLYQARKDYPTEFTCGYNDNERTYKVEYIIDLKYLAVSFDGDTYRPTEGSSILTVREGKQLNITCEILESFPPANVTLTIDNKQYKEIKIDRVKDQVNDVIKYYRYMIKFDRSMQAKQLTCTAKMDGLYLEKLPDVVTNITRTYKIDVQFKPTCQEKHYNIGFNRSVTMDCNVLSANPSVITYTFDPPNKNKELDSRQVNNNKLTVVPRTIEEMGAYTCVVKNIAGSNSCFLNLKLGDYPNPPYDCSINYYHNANKTRAKINCKVGFNQGGDRADFYVYERMKDGSLKFAGSVNIMDSTTGTTTNEMPTVDYLTREIDDYSYYEFVVMQNNNYGNSSQVTLDIGVREEKSTGLKVDKNTIIIIVCSIVGGIILLCICCCCCTNACSSNPNGRFFKCCSCCSDEAMDDIKVNDRNTSTYVSHRDDYLSTYKEDETKQEIKYIPTDNGLVYTPMLKSGSLNKENDDVVVIDIKNVIDNNNKNMRSSSEQHRSIYTYNDNNLTSSFRAELNQKLKQQRDELEIKLNNNNNNKSNNIELQTPASSYETTSSSSCTSNIDLILNNPNASKQQLLKPAILKPKPRRTIVNNKQSPSTSITDLSSINCTPQHFNNNNNDDNYALIHTSKSTYATIQRPRQRPPDAPIPPISTKISATTTFNRYVLTTTTNMDDSNTISNMSSNDESMLIKRQQQHSNSYIQKSDC